MNTVVIGAAREGKLPSLVLEHTIRKHAKEPVSIVHTWDKPFPEPKKPENRSRTGFSFVRFAVPALCGYEGLALYLENDQIVFRDVSELFAIPRNGATVLRPKNQASVLVIDCNHVRWDLGLILDGLDCGEYTYQNLMEDLCVEAKFKIERSIPNTWNSLEEFDAKKTALLHYTNMVKQPWRLWGHGLGWLWIRELADAVKIGRIPLEIVREEVAAKHVVPEVLAAVENEPCLKK